MATLRQLPIPKLACRELANRLLETILTAKKNAKRIDVVFDIYTENSIKVQKEIEDPKEVCNYSKLFLQVSSNNGMLCFLQMTTKINLLVVEEWKELHDKIGSKTFHVNRSLQNYI